MTLPGMPIGTYALLCCGSLTAWAGRSWPCRDLSDVPAVASAALVPDKSWKCSVLQEAPSALSQNTGICVELFTASTTQTERVWWECVAHVQPMVVAQTLFLRLTLWMEYPTLEVSSGSGTGFYQQWEMLTTLRFASHWTWTWRWKPWFSVLASSLTSCTLKGLLHNDAHQDRGVWQSTNWRQEQTNVHRACSQPSVICTRISLAGLCIVFPQFWLWEPGEDISSRTQSEHVFQLSIWLLGRVGVYSDSTPPLTKQSHATSTLKQ